MNNNQSTLSLAHLIFFYNIRDAPNCTASSYEACLRHILGNVRDIFRGVSIDINISDKPECKKCAKALQELENIDDEADQLGIGFVKIHDEELAEEYSLGDLPRLVYYRHQIPIIYEGT